MRPSPSSVADPRCSILLGIAVLIGVGEAWWGASALFAGDVEAGLRGTAGALDLIPLTATVIGGSCAVVALCALTWQLGLTVARRRSDTSTERR
ncbi:hypothetical protein [Microbacterium sp. NPDC089695]|uniref:hypothetical protein n=1 Tax=Microbacterium sp. NPDC089695 TaxID=3364198 RepID=UPI003806DFDF